MICRSLTANRTHSPCAVAAICKKRSKHRNQIWICHLGLLYLVDHSASVFSHSALQTSHQSAHSIGFRVGIQSNRDDPQNLVFEPVLLCRQGQMPVINRNGNNSNTATTPDSQVETTDFITKQIRDNQ